MLSHPIVSIPILSASFSILKPCPAPSSPHLKYCTFNSGFVLNPILQPASKLPKCLIFFDKKTVPHKMLHLSMSVFSGSFYLLISFFLLFLGKGILLVYRKAVLSHTLSYVNNWTTHLSTHVRGISVFYSFSTTFFPCHIIPNISPPPPLQTLSLFPTSSQRFFFYPFTLCALSLSPTPLPTLSPPALLLPLQSISSLSLCPGTHLSSILSRNASRSLSCC